MNKNEIYISMLKASLPYIRNVQTAGWLRKARDRSCYLESELLHNVVGSLSSEEFTSKDIYFLNKQARYYLEHATPKDCANYYQHKKNIELLFKLVPI